MSSAERSNGPSQHEIERLLPIRSRLLFDLSINSPIEFFGNTFWEELTCVGYNPQEAKLEAVVSIKRSSGYSDIVITGGDCYSYAKGTSFQGQVRVVDPFFWQWTLEVQPATHVHGPAVLPPCRVYTSIADSGDTAATYTIQTSQLDKCGYALILRGYDRTIINNNGAIVHSNAKAVGFSVV